jgi:hypothetical protein
MMSLSEFKPLDAQRAIRDDEALRGADKAFLWAAVLRTDNATRKVRASLAMLAKDAGFHSNTATNVFAETNEPVLRYFEKVDRQPRRIDLWFHPSARLTVGVSRDDAALTVGVSREVTFEIARTLHSQSVGVGPTVGMSRTHSDCEPSASLCPTSANILIRPSSLQSDDQATDTEPPPGSTSMQPLPTERSAAAEASRDEKLQCGCFPGMSCPECRGDVPTPSKHSPEKLRQFYEHRIERDEGLGLDGTPLDHEKPASGYRSRGRA